MPGPHHRPLDAMEIPRFGGIRTFMRAPHTTDLAGVDAAVYGIPFDTATSYRTGARFGPEAIRSTCGSWWRTPLLHRVAKLQQREDLFQSFRQIIERRASPNQQVLDQLLSAGLVRCEGGEVLPRCQLYADYFGR